MISNNVNASIIGLGNIDYNDLSTMNKGALDQIYQNLSSLLGKGIFLSRRIADLTKYE